MPPLDMHNGLNPEFYDETWSGGTLGPKEHHYDLDTLLGMMHVAEFHIVCESFEFRQRVGGKDETTRMNINLMSREYIGVAKRFYQERSKGGTNKGIHFRLQSAAEAKVFVSDEKLKIMGFWTGKTKHERDAYRHLIYYLVNRERRHDLIQSWRNL
jgi:rRNA processing protein Krr1/Pno1